MMDEAYSRWMDLIRTSWYVVEKEVRWLAHWRRSFADPNWVSVPPSEFACHPLTHQQISSSTQYCKFYMYNTPSIRFIPYCLSHYNLYNSCHHHVSSKLLISYVVKWCYRFNLTWTYVSLQILPWSYLTRQARTLFSGRMDIPFPT
jgi:hypothetical protein